MDFIPKPYPEAEIVRARIAKCVELAENSDLIRSTQRDKLTGLFNIDYFIRKRSMNSMSSTDRSSVKIWFEL